MAILMKLANGQGQCDRRCYDAQEERCTCRVCGGALHGIGQQQALNVRKKLLRIIEQEERIGEEQPYWIDETKRRQKIDVILVGRQVSPKIRRRLRAPAQVRAQVAAGQLPLWVGADRPTPLLPLARPRRRSHL